MPGGFSCLWRLFSALFRSIWLDFEESEESIRQIGMRSKKCRIFLQKVNISLFLHIFVARIAVNRDAASREAGSLKGHHIVGSIPTSVSSYSTFIHGLLLFLVSSKMFRSWIIPAVTKRFLLSFFPSAFEA